VGLPGVGVRVSCGEIVVAGKVGMDGVKVGVAV
jgi:hypothetical protein